jgi:hypothetical protein
MNQEHQHAYMYQVILLISITVQNSGFKEKLMTDNTRNSNQKNQP